MSISTKTLAYVDSLNLSSEDRAKLISALEYEQLNYVDVSSITKSITKDRNIEAKLLKDTDLEKQQKLYAKKLKEVNKFIAENNLSANILNDK
ncbi:MAG: hypothetical protein IKB42_03325 [Clostridia bacterium]|nr:hypothetical protein [Clostridia bacterium]